MSETKWVSPPWHFDGNDTGGWTITSDDGLLFICQRSDWPHRAEESAANGRLAAAAPDLYEACRIARLHADSIRLAPERRHTIAVLDAALAKARAEPMQEE